MKTLSQWAVRGVMDYASALQGCDPWMHRPELDTDEEAAYLAGWRAAAHDDLTRRLTKARGGVPPVGNLGPACG